MSTPNKAPRHHHYGVNLSLDLHDRISSLADQTGSAATSILRLAIVNGLAKIEDQINRNGILTMSISDLLDLMPAPRNK